jgi:hypothetical protein
MPRGIALALADGMKIHRAPCHTLSLALMISFAAGCTEPYLADRATVAQVLALPFRDRAHLAIPALRRIDGEHVYLRGDRFRPSKPETDGGHVELRATSRPVRMTFLILGGVIAAVGAATLAIGIAQPSARSSELLPPIGSLVPIELGAIAFTGGAALLIVGASTRSSEVAPGRSDLQYFPAR